MGQVPSPKGAANLEAYYSIVGGGRMASHLIAYFNLTKIKYAQWTRKSTSVSLTSQVHEDQRVAKESGCQHRVLLCVPDSSLETLCQSLKDCGTSSTLVHFSGATTILGTEAWHPLMSFAAKPYTLEQYRNILFVGRKGGRPFGELFPQLQNPTHLISNEKAPLYHALCVLGGNLPAMLFVESLELMKDELGIGSAFLKPYFSAIVENVISSGRAAVTGPLVRQDLCTQRANLNALETKGLASLYETFQKLAKEKYL